MNTENKKPLYKVLNEQRTQGEWVKEEDSLDIRVQAAQPLLLANFSLDCYIEGCRQVYLQSAAKDAAIPKHKKQFLITTKKYKEEYPLEECKKDISELHKQQRANAEYTALAVNNLHILAEALEKAIYDLEVMKQGKYFTDTSIIGKNLSSYKEALTKIS